MSDIRHIWTADPGERINSIASYRGKLMIATDRRLLQYDGETDTIQIIENFIIREENGPDKIIARYR